MKMPMHKSTNKSFMMSTDVPKPLAAGPRPSSVAGRVHSLCQNMGIHHLSRARMLRRFIPSLIGVVLLSACGVDKEHPKYDQRRYDELQRANCHDMASVLSSRLLMETPEEFDTALKRCQDTKSLSFEEYQALADYGRETGEWDIYAVYPEKRSSTAPTHANPAPEPQPR
jgi:hypothetical protein